MASADLRAELECSVCLNIYTDPVTLKCGHNFCWVCIDHVLDTQGGSGGYSCPECREKFQDRPTLQRNITLCNIASNFQSDEPSQEQSGVFCTHCVDSPVPAVRSCLHCEVSLCDKHLRVHKKSPEHILTDPTSSLESRKCSVHKKILEYYCTEDDTCICVACTLAGEHRGHQVQMLDEASGKKKETLRNVLQKLVTTREETEERVRSLQEHRRKVEEEAAGDTERVTALFIDLRRRLEVLEKRVLREISGRAERDSMPIVEMIRDLEIKKDELSRKMRHIEELCNMTDPLTVLQESDTGDLCDTEDGDDEDRERHDNLLHDGGGLDVAGILHTGLSDIITEVNVYFPIQEDTYILLDVNTAHNNLHISDDRKTVSWSDINQNRPETPQRFQDYYQVLSSRSFSSGRHYWEVDAGGSDNWIVGICYPSIDRRGVQSRIGWNKKSWGLIRYNNQYEMRHDRKEILLPANISSNRVRIDLNYEAGRISFYDLCDPIQHLHTFTTTFTEPLHAGIGIRRGYIKICGGADGDTERVTALFIDLRRRLEVLEKRVLREIFGRAERDSMPIVEMIRDLEIKKDELSRKMCHIEELCNKMDPLTVLQESDTGDLCDTEDGDDEDRERHDKLLHDGGGLGVAGILHTGLADVITEVNVYFPIQEATDILLDVNTAHNCLYISDDRKTVSLSDIELNRPETLERFQDCYQVLSSQSFNSGRHYWEVDVGGSDDWRVGMCYPSIDRSGGQSLIGWNKKSWGLYRNNNQYEVTHDSKEIPLPAKISSNRVRIDLDYEAGRISFYDLCEPMRHLHTFTTTFTEPLHAVLWEWRGYIKICGGNQGMYIGRHRLSSTSCNSHCPTLCLLPLLHMGALCAAMCDEQPVLAAITICRNDS
ncbi:E3 ubiquitin/ISG15 ligase TRIM25-like [Mantella aurantiaca]